MCCDPVLLAEIESALTMLAAVEVTYASEREKAEAEEGFEESWGYFRTERRSQPLHFDYVQLRSVRRNLEALMQTAKELGKEGSVDYHLVGAKLKLRFPEKDIENKSYSTADAQQHRPGDFLLGTSAIHVTVAPMPAVFTKCQRNIQDGLRPYLLVPEKLLQGARQNAELNVSGPLEVESIESFVAQNILEVSEFSSELLAKQFLRLLQIYNERVNTVEIDKSMLIEIPQSLLRRVS